MRKYKYINVKNIYKTAIFTVEKNVGQKINKMGERAVEEIRHER